MSFASPYSWIVHVNTSAPWWAAPLVGGIFALMGVGIAQYVTRRTGKRLRNDSQLRQAATAYVVAVQNYRGLVAKLEHDDSAERRRTVTLMRSEVYQGIVGLTLVAPQNVIDISWRFNLQAFMLSTFLSKGPTEGLNQFIMTHDDEMIDILIDFVSAIRKHF